MNLGQHLERERVWDGGAGHYALDNIRQYRQRQYDRIRGRLGPAPGFSE
jgi:hypothetical protein